MKQISTLLVVFDTWNPRDSLHLSKPADSKEAYKRAASFLNFAESTLIQWLLRLYIKDGLL